MKPIKLFSIIAISVFGVFSQVAAQSQSDEMKQSEAEARSILNAMSAYAKSCSTIEVKFTSSYENKRTGDKNTSQGSLMVKGDKYVLDVNGMVTYSDGKTIYVWQKAENEVDISDNDPDSEDAMTPSKLFGAYKTGYKLHHLADKKIAGIDCAQVDLYPSDTKTNIMRLRISIEKSTNRMRQFEQTTKSGESIVFLVKEFKVNQSIADSEFVFDTKSHSGVEVVDLR